MKKKLFVSVAVFTLSFVGCSHKQPKTDEITSANHAIEDHDLGSSDQGKAYGLQTIHFNFDSIFLDPEAKSLMAKNAEILKQHASAKIQIEGHCDNRGGIQYNVALGDKRANMVKKYLAGLGISEGRLTTISYAKERPIAMGDSEEDYAKNRRANFDLIAK
jgi:peptidoglycan-associated lipoprotein